MTPRTAVTLLAAELRVPVPVPPSSRIFVNGYQTWTESRELGPRDRIPSLNRLARSRCSMYGDYEFVTNPGFPGRFHGWTYGYVRTQSDLLTLFGSLAEQTGFTLVTVTASAGRVTLQKECGGVACRHLCPVRRVCGNWNGPGDVRPLFRPPWPPTSPDAASDRLDKLVQLLHGHHAGDHPAQPRRSERTQVPLDVFQIDDGWQHAVGDWLTANAQVPGRDGGDG